MKDQKPRPLECLAREECHIQTTRTGTSLIRNTGGFHFRRTASIASSTPKEVKMSRIVQFTRYGAPEVLEFKDIQIPG
jgi:hypothetical protein